MDTEFLWEKTYRPTLCLIQVAGGGRAAAIDALAPGIDLEPVYRLMRDGDVLKVFHSASQDLDIFYGLMGSVPGPVFDTQIAGAVCGYGEQPSYARLVDEILGIDLDKAAQRTDWSLRPLTEKQVDYAVGDVLHLGAVYEFLDGRLTDTGRREWVSEDMSRLSEESVYRVEPRDAWRRVRLRRPKRRALAVLREVAEWRERSAMRRNLPRAWVMSDGALAEIAHNAPDTAVKLERVRGLHKGFAHRPDGREVLRAVRRVLRQSADEWPSIDRPAGGEGVDKSATALLRALLKLRCEQHGVAEKMVSNQGELARLASGDSAGVRALHGWRRKVFGEDALALIEGRIALTQRDGVMRVVDIPAAGSGGTRKF